MDTEDIIGRLAVAFGIGLLFGIERGWQEREEGDGSRTAGIRTFTLIGLLGGIWAAMTPMLGGLPLAAAGAVMGGAFTLFYWREMSARKEFSVTSVVVALTAFALGAFAMLGSTAAASAAAVTAVAILAARQRMHDFVKALTWPELRSGVLLLAMSFVALPVLPDRPIDPWGAFNPHELWLMTVLIAVVSFAGYAAVRLMGQKRGLLLSSAAGALVSSTTVTINNARQARNASHDERGVLAAAICLAWIVSFLRMTTVACIANIGMLAPLAFPILAAVSVLGVALFLLQRGPAEPHGTSTHAFDNPLDLSFVLKFGALLAFVTVAANFANRSLGEGGVFGLAGISGFVDVDPITLSVSRSAAGSMMYREAAEAILLAAAANMVTKMTAAATLGGLSFGLKLVAAGALALAAAGAVLIVYGL